MSFLVQPIREPFETPDSETFEQVYSKAIDEYASRASYSGVFKEIPAELSPKVDSGTSSASTAFPSDYDLFYNYSIDCRMYRDHDHGESLEKGFVRIVAGTYHQQAFLAFFGHYDQYLDCQNISQTDHDFLTNVKATDCEVNTSHDWRKVLVPPKNSHPQFLEIYRGDINNDNRNDYKIFFKDEADQIVWGFELLFMDD